MPMGDRERQRAVLFVVKALPPSKGGARSNILDAEKASVRAVCHEASGEAGASE